MITERQLKNFQIDDVSVNDLILAKKAAELLKEGREELSLESESWLDEVIDNIDSEVQRITKADIKRRLAKARARREELKTVSEKRKGLDAEIEALESQLNS